MEWGCFFFMCVCVMLMLLCADIWLGEWCSSGCIQSRFAQIAIVFGLRSFLRLVIYLCCHLLERPVETLNYDAQITTGWHNMLGVHHGMHSHRRHCQQTPFLFLAVVNP